MSVNRHKPHVLVLPEDDANRPIANGFLHLARNIHVEPVANGWLKVLDMFESDHRTPMAQFPHRFIVLLIDFDGNENRRDVMNNRIPTALKDRVFVLGTLKEPEDLKPDFGSYESIGEHLAEDCRDGTEKTWSHNLLKHNASELARMSQSVRPILFP